MIEYFNLDWPARTRGSGGRAPAAKLSAHGRGAHAGRHCSGGKHLVDDLVIKILTVPFKIELCVTLYY